MTLPAPQFRCYREIDEARRPEALAKGYRHRHFFPHQTRYVPKWGPDGFRLAMRMCGAGTAAEAWEIVLYATGDTLTGLISGFLAQAYGTLKDRADAITTVVAALYVGGLAGDFAAKRLGMRAMLASDIREHFTDAIRAIDPLGDR